MRTIPFSDARANLKQVIDNVVDDVEVTLITRRNAPKCDCHVAGALRQFDGDGLSVALTSERRSS